MIPFGTDRETKFTELYSQLRDIQIAPGFSAKAIMGAIRAGTSILPNDLFISPNSKIGIDILV